MGVTLLFAQNADVGQPVTAEDCLLLLALSVSHLEPRLYSMPEKDLIPISNALIQKYLIVKVHLIGFCSMQFSMFFFFFWTLTHNHGPGMSHTPVSHTQICAHSVILKNEFFNWKLWGKY